MNERVFINYRRETDKAWARLLFDCLQSDLGEDGVFLDIDGIFPGEDFVEEITRRVAECDVFLAVLGRNWLDVRDDTGIRRVDKPNDWVRIEIESALAQSKRIIPLLVDGAEMPSSDQLPESLVPFSRRHAAKLSYEQFRADAARVVSAIREFRENRRRRTEEEGAKAREQEETRRKEETAHAERAAEDKRRVEAAEAAHRLEAEKRAARDAEEARLAEARRQAEIAASRRDEEQRIREEATARREREMKSARVREIFGNLKNPGAAPPPTIAQFAGEPAASRSESMPEERDHAEEQREPVEVRSRSSMSARFAGGDKDTENVTNRSATSLSGGDVAFEEALIRVERSRASRSSPTTLALLFALLGGALVIVWPALFPRQDSLPAARDSPIDRNPSVETNSDRSGPKNDLNGASQSATASPYEAPSRPPPPAAEEMAPVSESTVAPDEAPAQEPVEKHPSRKKTRKKSRSK